MHFHRYILHRQIRTQQITLNRYNHLPVDRLLRREHIRPVEQFIQIIGCNTQLPGIEIHIAMFDVVFVQQ